MLKSAQVSLTKDYSEINNNNNAVIYLIFLFSGCLICRYCIGINH